MSAMLKRSGRGRGFSRKRCSDSAGLLSRGFVFEFNGGGFMDAHFEVLRRLKDLVLLALKPNASAKAGRTSGRNGNMTIAAVEVKRRTVRNGARRQPSDPGPCAPDRANPAHVIGRAPIVTLLPSTSPRCAPRWPPPSSFSVPCVLCALSRVRVCVGCKEGDS